MKKLFAILLLAVMVFNLVGYRLLFSYMDNKVQANMVKQLDENTYTADGLLEVKIPLQLPYTTNWKSFERFDGVIELNGVSYSYFERKISNDTLVLHCVPNLQRDHLKKAQKDFARAVNDFQHPQGHKDEVPSLIKSLLLEFTGQHITYDYNVCAIKQTAYVTVNDALITSRFLASPEQPPELA